MFRPYGYIRLGNAASGDAIYTGVDNVAIAAGTLIENAYGGSGMIRLLEII